MFFSAKLVMFVYKMNGKVPRREVWQLEMVVAWWYKVYAFVARSCKLLRDKR